MPPPELPDPSRATAKRKPAPTPAPGSIPLPPSPFAMPEERATSRRRQVTDPTATEKGAETIPLPPSPFELPAPEPRAQTPEQRATSRRQRAEPPKAVEKGGEHDPAEWKLGEYRVVRLLGEGAMGKVYEAVQESLGRTVALKVLPEDFARDPDAVARFEREAKAAAGLLHPNIVPVYQFGFDDGHWYYAMELVRGRSMRDLLKDPKKPLDDQKKVAKYILNSALAVEHANAKGVIHRDVKPDNILVREDDQVMVTDFGLARKQDAKAITQAGALMGTPVYMAPEQAMGKPVDARADVYALGVTLYECLSGKLPFFAPGLRELLVMITQDPPPRLQELRPDVSPDLAAIAYKCLQKDKADRYPSCKALADDIIRYFRGEIPDARRVTRWERFAQRARKHPAVVALATTLAVVLVSWLGVSRVVARSAAAARAEKNVEAARKLLGDRPKAVAAARDELAQARGERDQLRPGAAAAERRAARAKAAAEVTDALRGLEAAEATLFERTASADAPASRALEMLREALVVAPRGHGVADEARALTRDLVVALRFRAVRQGDAALAAACARELVTLGDGEAGPRGPLRLVIETEPQGARVTLHPIQQGAGGWEPGAATFLGQTPLDPGVEVQPGEHLLVLEAPGAAPVRVPLLVDEASGVERLELRFALPRAEAAPAGFAWVPPGECPVGGDPRAVRPLAAVRTPVWTDGFFLGEAEVTVAEYVAFLAALPEGERADHLSSPLQLDLATGVAARAGHEGHPVAGVRLESARAYARWRSAREPGRRYRLPTDVEWEKAARGPAARAFPWGDAFDPTGRLAQLHLGDDGGRPRIAPVRAHPIDRSIHGAYDLAGNLCEWVEGTFDGNPRFGVLRGGSWDKAPEVVRLASREPIDSSDTADFLRVRDRVGFRLALDAE